MNTYQYANEQTVQQVNTVLRDTHRLLSWTLLFSAVTAALSYALVPELGTLFANPLMVLLPYFFFLWMIHKNESKPSALIWVFGLTGWLGLSLGPMLYFVINVNGFGPVVNALAATGLIFMATSALGKRFPAMLKLGGILMTGIMVAFVLSIVNLIFFQNSLASVLLGGVFAVLSSGLIAWQTASIVHGGERSYIMATVTLFVSLYNIFSILLHLFAANDD